MSDRELGVGGRIGAVTAWGRRLAVRDWPALLVAAACLGLSASVWVRPDVTLVAVHSLLSSSSQRC